MPTVAQILKAASSGDNDRAARFWTGTVQSISKRTARVVITPGGAVLTAAVPLDVPAAAGSRVVVLDAPHCTIVLGRLS
ncbi:hypothetical protein KGQ20_13930 [Catenulispora sp. NF23]|uniref:hypothetical protein n=1 Tax=Catenulispora pinistramenti TaxID=2705254 RepID=UPI001BAC4950|nr:hypothetical protein [Catenulispora pinistramenti]MBS2533868.1 hypothetical protein [Catenulispora pinistramenti]